MLIYSWQYIVEPWEAPFDYLNTLFSDRLYLFLLEAIIYLFISLFVCLYIYLFIIS